MKCLNCKWWKCGGMELDGTPYTFGWCCKHPPQVFQKTKDISKGYQDYCTIVTAGNYTAWPKTNDTDFCGDYKEK